jgi:hypothetical protein
MNGRSASAGSVPERSAARGADGVTITAICPACGYPRLGPGVCAYWLPVPTL